MSHALLLRLAQSQHWSLHSALQYLAEYVDHIGISYYITRRLRECPANELRDVWGFICHLLVTRPTTSAALECFVLEQAELSTHLTVMTIWFFQAHLIDHPSLPSTSKPFAVCERVLRRCHELIYADVPQENAVFHQSPTIYLNRKHVSPHANALFVGMGLTLAGYASPPTSVEMGKVALSQGRHIDGQRSLPQSSIHARKGDRPQISLNGDVSISTNQEVSSPQDDPVGHENEEIHDVAFALESTDSSKNSASHPLSTAIEASKWKPLFKYPSSVSLRPEHSHTTSLRPSVTGQSIVGHSMQNSKSMDLSISTGRVIPHMSTPSLPLRQSFQSPEHQSSFPALPGDTTSQRLTLQKNYLQKEVQFIMALNAISDKLVNIPKPARVSALRAQLTALNLQLPTEVCVPLWCRSSDSLCGDSDLPQPHHRVVRIPASECVVLNSAEKAPYLLLIEFTEADLNFDPSKRRNREILRSGLANNTFVQAFPLRLMDTSGSSTPVNVLDESPTPEIVLHSTDMESREQDQAEGDEMDVVEQALGTAKFNLIDEADFSEVNRPQNANNKTLDSALWAGTEDQSRGAVGNIGPLWGNSTGSLHDLGNMTLEEYSQRMSTAAAMLGQLNAILLPAAAAAGFKRAENFGSLGFISSLSSTVLSGPASGSDDGTKSNEVFRGKTAGGLSKSQRSDAESLRQRIMQEMNTLEEERMRRMQLRDQDLSAFIGILNTSRGIDANEDIIRRELRREDPSAAIFQEPWQEKKSRVRAVSPYGHLANWDCASVIVKTGSDLRQEQLAVHLIREFGNIFQEEHCRCYVRPFHVLITGATSGLVETITDAVSVHSIKKAMYARRMPASRFEQVTLLDHFVATYGENHNAKFKKAQRNFAQSLAGYSLVTYFLQIKDRHNGNILLDRDGHLIHIDFGFMLSNSPGNLGFEAAPFKLPLEYVDVLGGIDGDAFYEFQQQFRAGFLAARKHSQRIITLVELMQKDSSLPCFSTFGEQTSVQLRERFHGYSSSVEDHIDKLIITSLGNAWTRLYDSYQYYSQSIF